MKDWPIIANKKLPEPVLKPEPELLFFCPVSRKNVKWQFSNVYNPAAVVKDGKVHLVYRADDEPKGFKDIYGNEMVTCRLGYAVSGDGISFVNRPVPVLYPDEDGFKKYEWDGGCQDLHIVEGEDRRYYMNYTAWTGSFDGKKEITPFCDTLHTAVSDDLINWKKCGPAFKDGADAAIVNASRSGVIVTSLKDGRLIAKKLGGFYIMYYGHCGWIARSENLIEWKQVYGKDGKRVSLFPNFISGTYAELSCEAGAAALLSEHGINYFFNAAKKTADNKLEWTQGQALIDSGDISKVKDFIKQPSLKPEYDWEKSGYCEAPAVVCNTIVRFNGKWLMYYGAADKYIGLAKSE